MKRNIFLIFLFSFFIIPFSANALTFNVCDKEYEVSDFDTMRDYVYYTYIKNDLNKYYFLVQYGDSSYLFAYSDLGIKPYFKTIDGMSSYTGEHSDVIYRNSTDFSFYSKVISSVDSNNFKSTGRLDFPHLYNSSVLTTSPIYSSNDFSNISIDSNWNFEDIENKYLCTSDDPIIPDVPSTTLINISKEEFMLIPFLLSLLILMLFFKWCFPMKGGKKI